MMARLNTRDSSHLPGTCVASSWATRLRSFLLLLLEGLLLLLQDLWFPLLLRLPLRLRLPLLQRLYLHLHRQLAMSSLRQRLCRR